MTRSKRTRRHGHEFTHLPEYVPRRRERRRIRRRQRRAEIWARYRAYVVGIGASIVLLGVAAALWLHQRVDWDAQVAAAVALRAEGAPERAAAALKTLLIERPDHAEGRWELGLTLVSLEDGASAFKELERAESLGFRHPQLFSSKLVALLLDGKFTQVLRQLVFVSELEFDPVLTEMQARAQLGLGRIDAAREALLRVVELAPERESARLWLGRVALRQNDLTLATAQANALVDAQSPSPAAWVLKGETDLTNEQPERAEIAFRAALGASGTHVGAKLGLARSLLMQNRPEPAERVLAEVLAAAQDHPVATFLAANAHSMRGDARGGIALGQDVLSRYPLHHPSLLLVAALHVQENELPQAELLLRRAVKGQPGDPRAQKLLASIELATGQTEPATKRLEALAVHPAKDLALATLLAAAYLQSGRAEAAAAVLRKALPGHPNSPELLTELGLVELEQGNDKIGEQTLLRAIALSPHYTRPYLILGAVRLETGRAADAAETLRTLVEIDEDNVAGWYLLGVAELVAGRETASRSSLERALVFAPDYIPALWRYARLLHSAGEDAAAQDRYAAIVRFDPGHTPARLELARLALERSDKTAAQAQLRSVLGDEPDHEGAVRELVRLYLNENRPSQALQIVRSAWQKSPAPFADALADLLVASGDYPAAADVLRGASHTESHHARQQIVEALTDGTSNHDTGLASDRPPAGAQSRLMSKAVRAIRNNQLVEAEVLGHDLSRRYPKSANGELVRADVYVARSNLAGAMAALENALPKTSTPRVVKRLVQGWQALNATRRAEAVLKARLKSAPHDVVAHGLLGQIALRAARFEDASRHYEALLRYQRDHPQALNNLAWAYYRRGDARALRLAEDAFQLAPDAPAVADTYGWLLVEVGQIREGARILEAALAAAPKDPFVRYHLAVAYSRTEQHQRARMLLRALDDEGSTFPEREAAEALLTRLIPAGG